MFRIKKWIGAISASHKEFSWIPALACARPLGRNNAEILLRIWRHHTRLFYFGSGQFSHSEIPRPMIHSLSVVERKSELFGKKRHHLLVRTREMGQIRAPKTALWPEGLDDTADERVKGREGVRLGDVTRQRGDFHGDVFQMGLHTKIIDGAIERIARNL